MAGLRRADWRSAARGGWRPGTAQSHRPGAREKEGVHVRRARMVVGGVAACAAVAAAGTLGSAGATPLVASTSMATCTAKIGFMGPFTGSVAFLGQEQLHWGQF